MPDLTDGLTGYYDGELKQVYPPIPQIPEWASLIAWKVIGSVQSNSEWHDAIARALVEVREADAKIADNWVTLEDGQEWVENLPQLIAAEIRRAAAEA